MERVEPHTVDVDQFRADLPEAMRDKFDEILSEVDELRDACKAADEDHAYELAEMRNVLESVRYWFLDILVHARPTSDPRRLLRLVERVLGWA